MTPPLLVFGWGNLSRGDDALGPLFVERLRVTLLGRRDVELLEDHQLQVEHALDLLGRERVLFVDASVMTDAPFAAVPLKPARDGSFSSHALSPQALLQVHASLYGPPPPSTLLAIRGEHFLLGEPPGAGALANLDAALVWAQGWLRREQAVHA